RVTLLLERGHVDLLDAVDQLRIGRRGRLNAAELLVIDQRGDGGVSTANRAVRILAQLQLAETHAQRIHQQQAPDQRIALAQDQLNDLSGLDDPDEAWENPKHSTFRTGRNQSWRWR